MMLSDIFINCVYNAFSSLLEKILKEFFSIRKYLEETKMMFAACFARNTTNSLIRTFLAVPTRSLSSLVDVKFNEKHGKVIENIENMLNSLIHYFVSLKRLCCYYNAKKTS